MPSQRLCGLSPRSGSHPGLMILDTMPRLLKQLPCNTSQGHDTEPDGRARMPRLMDPTQNSVLPFGSRGNLRENQECVFLGEAPPSSSLRLGLKLSKGQETGLFSSV